MGSLLGTTQAPPLPKAPQGLGRFWPLPRGTGLRWGVWVSIRGPHPARLRGRSFMLARPQHPNKETPLFLSEWVCLD